MPSIISVSGLAKHYASGPAALSDINLDIREGEIFALLGPNGAGKTTLISIICGLVMPSGGTVCVSGHDILKDYRAARALIGLVPQELSTDLFETVWGAVTFSRGLFNKPFDATYLETVLRDLSLWDRKDRKIGTLSGGMKRRLLIAKALAHEPKILFLDEPTAGVDVTLRHDMWTMVRRLRTKGVTIVLTTHYIEEAEEMADRIGVIDRGRIKLVDDKISLMEKLGRTEVTLSLGAPIDAVPLTFGAYQTALSDDGRRLTITLAGEARRSGIAEILKRSSTAAIELQSLETRQSSLEDIFLEILEERA